MPDFKHSDPPAKTAVANHLAKLRVKAYGSPFSLLLARVLRCPFCSVLRITLAIGFIIFLYLVL
jgi:hypothetical protein